MSFPSLDSLYNKQCFHNIYAYLSAARNRELIQKENGSFRGMCEMSGSVTNTGLWGSTHVLAVRPWQTGCLLYLVTLLPLSLSFRFVVLV
jgi:hypothetical protein